MTQAKQTVKVEKKDGIAWLIFDNPPVNVFDSTNMLEVAAALKKAGADPEVKVVVFTNAGERAFSAGMSIQQHDPSSGSDLGGGEHAISEAGWHMEKPLIAAVNG
ncbi:MAG: enoyl-CoA hydratase/isomerase family protein, partial [Chloroflexi bacterium]|nr:enoyl-CoA hydratase/isomerase family protein [Chloroflexota bacterium]